ncbi:MAG TPA: CocE/NonD family hydrolase [Gemmatales bacterium]|nr:CocE/NonD family hydrolase [Gemmatales bacterium]HMP60626.1 CocE/NonD family hydrolase [Gemmatales bacterium]
MRVVMCGRRLGWLALVCLAAWPLGAGLAQAPTTPRPAAAYVKKEVQIPMRDGVKLFTSIYAPRDTSRTYPILMLRTPYSVAPYGETLRPSVGPSASMAEDGYIFVYQDVRGCFMSEGQFRNLTPHRPTKSGPQDVDESSDTYDTIEWLLAHVENHNGRVGQWGISYPGFYAAAGMIDAHPALKAVSPQAPVSDFYFDDFHHHGAFFLAHAFEFIALFDQPRTGPTKTFGQRFQYPTTDGYAFHLDLGPLKNINERYFHGKKPMWQEMVEHPNYDEHWQSRNIVPHLKNVAPAVMVVGGWFDTEDLWGPLEIYKSIERQNPKVFNCLVMGPWRHGGWSRGDADQLGNILFGAKTGITYREEMERTFFKHFLKDEGEHGLAEANVFETGANQWRRFDVWPPQGLRPSTLHLHAGGKLRPEPPTDDGSDSFLSDPARPVPYTEAFSNRMTVEYMTDDQRFAARRPDVLVYQTDVLAEDLTMAGLITAHLHVSTTETDADWVVKVIDVFPYENPPETRRGGPPTGGYQMMVRSEVIRGRYRNSYEKPEPFKPGEPALVRLPLQDVCHTFKKGHRVMIQIQSTWFPLVDRNPQKYVDNIFLAEEADFIPATHTVHRSARLPTRIEFGVLPAAKE